MKKFFGTFILISCIALQAFADAPAPTKIADCKVAADAQGSVEQIQVLRVGNENTESAITVHVTVGNVDETFPALQVEMEDGGQTLGIRYGRGGMLVLLIHNGNSSADTAGVTLGQNQAMTCQASF